MPFTPVHAPNVADAAAAQLRELIAVDVLRPGDALPAERALSERMGISRASLRSALQTLIAEGLIVAKQGAGLRVADDFNRGLADPLVRLLESGPDAVVDYLEFRGMLEGESAALAAARASAAERERIAAADGAMAEAVRRGDFAAASDADVEFHMAVVEASGNVVAIQVARSLHELLRRGVERSHRRASLDPATWTDLSAQHAPITAAIGAGDADAARAAMRAHLDHQRAAADARERAAARDALDARRRAWAAETTAPRPPQRDD